MSIIVLVSESVRVRIVTGDTSIIHQDLWSGKLVPSPYKRSELTKSILHLQQQKGENLQVNSSL